MSRQRRTATWAALVTLAASVVALVTILAAHARPTAREIRHRLLTELRPVALSNCTLTRVGSVNDGGYLMCGNLLGNVGAAYSYGIGPADDWGCEISRTHRVTVHQYDCFDPFHPPCPDGQAVFHDECIGPRTEALESRVFDRLARQIARNGDARKRLVLKIDVEGAELESLMATPEGVLDRIDQLAMEIHGTDQRFLRLVQKLKRTFYPAHIHFNNQSCSVRYSPFPAWAYQVLFVNKRLAHRDPALPAPVLPHPLDAPDFALGRDCQIHGTIED